MKQLPGGTSIVLKVLDYIYEVAMGLQGAILNRLSNEGVSEFSTDRREFDRRYTDIRNGLSQQNDTS